MLIDLALSKQQPAGMGEGTHQLNGRLTAIAIAAAPYRFAVHGNDLTALNGEGGFHPVHKALLEGLAVHQPKDPSKGVMRRYSPWQRQVLVEPLRFRFPKLLYLAPAFGPTQHRTHCHHNDVYQHVVTCQDRN